MNRITFHLFPILFACAGATETTWDTLKFPAHPTPQSVRRYLRDVRVLTNPSLAPHTTHSSTWHPPTIDAETLKRARLALGVVPVERLELILEECQAAEKEWSNSRIEVWKQTPDGQKEIAGFDAVGTRFRTPFTQLAIIYLNHQPDVPALQREALFESLETFPEFVAIIARRPWFSELDRYVSVALMKKLDRSGWRGTAPYWIDCLLRINSPGAWKAIEYLMVNCEVAVQVAAYRAVRIAPAPKLDLPRTVAKAWQTYKLDVGQGHPTIYAPIAAEHGNSDALLAMADSILDKQNPDASARYGPVLISLLAPRFTEAQPAANFVVNSWDKLVFDPATKKYDLRVPITR